MKEQIETASFFCRHVLRYMIAYIVCARRSEYIKELNSIWILCELKKSKQMKYFQILVMLTVSSANESQPTSINKDSKILVDKKFFNR